MNGKLLPRESRGEDFTFVSSELEDCPFCGAAPQIRHPYEKVSSGGCWVECTECCCEVGRGSWDSQEQDNGVFDSYEEAAKAWNKRS